MDPMKPHPQQSPTRLTPTGARPTPTSSSPGAASSASRVEGFIRWLRDNREMVEGPDKGAITFDFSGKVFKVEMKQRFENST